MIKALPLFLLLFGTTLVHAQTVSSTCSAPDSIVGLYQEDASRLALRKILRNNLAYKDSVVIPKTHVDTVLNAMLAVYNSNLAASDTVISLLNIHTSEDPAMKRIYIAADSSLTWMQQLKSGNMATGNAYLNNLINKHQLQLDSYWNFSYAFPYHKVIFKSAVDYNMQPLAILFEAIPGVQHAGPNTTGLHPYRFEITDSIFSDHVELKYYFGWGDCISGCINWRYWKFKFFYDCSVEFVGSYGDVFRYTGTKEIDTQSISLYPNPFKDVISVKGFQEPFNYTISNLMGQELIKGYAINSQIENLDKLRAGVYLLTIQAKSKTTTIRIYRQ